MKLRLSRKSVKNSRKTRISKPATKHSDLPLAELKQLHRVSAEIKDGLEGRKKDRALVTLVAKAKKIVFCCSGIVWK